MYYCLTLESIYLVSEHLYIEYKISGRKCANSVHLKMTLLMHCLPSRGRYFSFCASVPYALMGCMTRDDWTLMTER